MKSRLITEFQLYLALIFTFWETLTCHWWLWPPNALKVLLSFPMQQTGILVECALWQFFVFLKKLMLSRDSYILRIGIIGNLGIHKVWFTLFRWKLDLSHLIEYIQANCVSFDSCLALWYNYVALCHKCSTTHLYVGANKVIKVPVLQ